MRYEKPQLVFLAQAAKAVRASGNKPSNEEIDGAFPLQTASAYEADE